MSKLWIYDKNNNEVYSIPLRNILDTLNIFVGTKTNVVYFDNKQSAERLSNEST
mgnify:CR=1 FL=1